MSPLPDPPPDPRAESRARERALLQMCGAATEARTRGDVFVALTHHLIKVLPFDRAVFVEVRGETAHTMLLHAADPRLASVLPPPFPWRGTVSEPAILGRRVFSFQLDAGSFPGASELVGVGLNSAAIGPVTLGDELYGIFAIAFRSPELLGGDDLDLFARACQLFGLSVLNARAHEENARLAQRERDLLELTNVMTLHRDLQEVLSHMLPALERMVRLLPSDLAALFEVEADRLTLAAASGPEFLKGPSWETFQCTDLAIAAPLHTGNAQRMEVSEDWSPVALDLRRAEFATVLCLPLMIHGAAVGLLLLASPRADAFAGEDLETLTRVTQKLGLALEAGRRYREVKAREQRLELENTYLKEELSESAGTELVGVGPAMAAVRDLVRKVARTSAAVLVRGESGTGKELVAEAVHRMGTRAGQPLIKVNCAALPESLISSELFGHEKGAFTGAVSQRIGRFELARGGTVLLDEIGELSPEVQAKLLRVLQQGEFERVGSNTTLHTDARVVAATNRNLERAVAQGRFREDLFYRLNVFPIHIPPLRQRIEDILVLAYYFLHRISRRMGKTLTRLSPASEVWMMSYAWPGNVRELENLIERAVILCEGSELRVEPVAGDASAEGIHPLTAADSIPTTLAAAERRHIELALRRAGGRVAGPLGAAALLGIKRTTLNSRMKKLGISRLKSLQ